MQLELKQLYKKILLFCLSIWSLLKFTEGRMHRTRVLFTLLIKLCFKILNMLLQIDDICLCLSYFSNPCLCLQYICKLKID